MFRYSLAALLVVVLASGLGCAALVRATVVWQQAALMLTVLVLLFSLPAALFSHGRLRACAGGLATVGWLYFLLAFVPALGLRERLLTQRAVDGLWNVFHPDQADVRAVAFSAEGTLLLSKDADLVRLWDAKTGAFVSGGPSFAAFADIGHALWTLLLACLGGIIARYLAEKTSAASSAST
jgi:hypothetical protein